MIQFSVAVLCFSVLISIWLQLPREQGIGGREYMAAIRIVPINLATGSSQPQFQSARTRCVNRIKEIGNDKVQVIWDEIFLFEVQSRVCLLRFSSCSFFGRYCF